MDHFGRPASTPMKVVREHVSDSTMDKIWSNRIDSRGGLLFPTEPLTQVDCVSWVFTVL